jgi:alpha-L-rhamnosidase
MLNYLSIVFLAAALSVTASNATATEPTAKVFPTANLTIAADPSPAWQIDRMTCEYRVDPLGMDEPHPRFAWAFRSNSRNQYQSAYHILVASSRALLEKNIGDIWDSGATPSDDNINIRFGGKTLSPFTRYFWKIRAINRSGEESPWSAVAWFETAFLHPANWQGTWIGNGQEPPPERDEDFYKDRPAPWFKKEFSLTRTVSSARLYISGLGYYEAYLNGKKIGDQVLDPGWTNYDRTVLYTVYDITASLHTGPNAIGVLLGNGWYNPLPMKLFGAFNLRKALAIGEPKLIANILIRYTDGSTSVIATDSSWRTGGSFILKNNTYLGEEQDARLIDSSWCMPRQMPGSPRRLPASKHNDSAAPSQAIPVPAPQGEMQAQSSPPIRITRIFHPRSLSEPAKGIYVFDLGQNFAGWIRMRIKASRGTQIHFRYGELIYPDGRVNGMTTVAGHIKAIWRLGGGPGAPPTAYQEDSYTCSGKPGEFFEPHFTFHAFRYVEISGLPGRPDRESLEGLRLNADLEKAGHFTCSDTLLNQIQQTCLSTFLSNVFSVQSDCPGREKQGYGADMVVSSEAFAYNFDMSCFYAKAVQDFANDARPNGAMPECAPYDGIATEGFDEGAGPAGWQLAFPFLQEKLYRFYGNKKILEDQYARTKKMVEFLRGQSVDHLIYHDIGDHVAVNAKHVPLTAGAFYYHHVRLLAEFAQLLGISGDAKEYRLLADSIRDSFNRHYLQGAGAYDTAHNQTTQVFALWYDLAPQPEKDQAFSLLLDEIQKNKGHLSTGIFGTKMLFDVLRRYDRNDIAYTINTQPGFPGYGYMLRNGATTLWETWDRPEQDSWNHPMFGSVSEWFYRSLAGIDPAEDACGMDRLVIKPFTGAKLRFVKSDYRSPRGRIVSEWQQQPDGLHWRLVIPPNTKAQVYIPARAIGDIFESGLPVQQIKELDFVKMENGFALFNAVSGEYHFRVR